MNIMDSFKSKLKTPRVRTWIRENCEMYRDHWLWKGMERNGIAVYTIKKQDFDPPGTHRVPVARLAWLAFRGRLHDETKLTKLCDHKLCVNPHHYCKGDSKKLGTRGGCLKKEEVIQVEIWVDTKQKTQKECAEHYKVSQPTISRIKRGLHGKCSSWAERARRAREAQLWYMDKRKRKEIEKNIEKGKSLGEAFMEQKRKEIRQKLGMIEVEDEPMPVVSVIESLEAENGES